LPNLGSLLEKEFDRVRDQWWKIGKKLGQTISARLAHMPTAASYNSDFGLMMAWVGLTNRVCKESNPCLVVCDDPWLFRELEGIDGIAAGRRPPIWPQTVRGWARGYLARTILALRLVITSLLLRYTRKNICSGNNVLIVYGHPQSKADGDDTYFGSLMTHIPSLRRLIHTDADLGNTRRLSRKRTAGLHAWGSIFFAPLIIFKRWRPRQADITGEFSWLIRRAVAFETQLLQLLLIPGKFIASGVGSRKTSLPSLCGHGKIILGKGSCVVVLRSLGLRPLDISTQSSVRSSLILVPLLTLMGLAVFQTE